ncbi:NUDIX domain-containing protein [soil metagenome]
MYKTPAYVAIILKKDNQVLLVKRTNTDWASGQWNFPGGLFEENETLAAAAAREAQEEVGVAIATADLHLVHVMHSRKNEKHTKEIFGFYFLATQWNGEAINNEPHRHSEIGWFDLNNLPENITAHAMQAITSLQNKVLYSEN